jgi:hypothetical protein
MELLGTCLLYQEYVMGYVGVLFISYLCIYGLCILYVTFLLVCDMFAIIVWEIEGRFI